MLLGYIFIGIKSIIGIKENCLTILFYIKIVSRRIRLKNIFAWKQKIFKINKINKVLFLSK